MYTLALALLAAAPAQPPAAHVDQNPLYKNLLDTGIDVGGGVKVKFAAPTLPDGLDAAKQTAVVKELIGTQYSYDEFTRNSVVAPQVLKIRDIIPSDPKAPARGVDVYFVVHGDFKRLEDDKFLDKFTGSNKGTGKGGPLAAEDLTKRNIVIPKGNEKREGYGKVEFDFLEKVRLNATGHAMWSRNPESVVAAAEIDPRFVNDKEFPNQWRPIDKTSGQAKVGDPSPWSGAAMYLKMTKLAEPAGAIFIEQHVVFAEPVGWFAGANLLRSKLPIALQDSVRNMRREFQKK